MLTAESERTTGRVSRLTILTATPAHRVDGIHDYTRQLTASLRDRPDIEVSCGNPREASLDWLSGGGQLGDQHRSTVLLQYNPFNFGRWGFAPWLPAKLWRLKHSRPAPSVAVMAHELYYPITDWRSALMGGWQRLQFFLVRILSDVIFTSVSAWATELEHQRPRRPVYHLPVASNLPDMRQARAAERERLGVSDDTVVLAAFGTAHPTRMMDYIARAAESVASAGTTTVLLNLGWDTPPVMTHPSVRVVTPGPLEGYEISRYLAAADIYLAPFTDGVSTRRGSLMAALQHGLPVIGTDGHNTDEILRDATSALTLIPVGDQRAFTLSVCTLAANPATRADRGARARALYEQEFDWPVISSRLLAGLLNGRESGSAPGVRRP